MFLLINKKDISIFSDEKSALSVAMLHCSNSSKGKFEPALLACDIKPFFTSIQSYLREAYGKYRIYPKYSDSSTPYHTYSKI